MGSQTMTATAWGQLHVFYQEDGSQRVRAICKACTADTVVVLGRTADPFTVRPDHDRDCKLHPAAVRRVVAPTPGVTHVAPASPWWWIALAGGVGAGAAWLAQWVW